MNIVIGSDHAGYHLKLQLAEHLRSAGHGVTDVGSHDPAPVDFPDIARALCGLVRKGGVRGLMVCGTGVGAAIAANKVRGIRAALAWTTQTARLARQHNDANVLSLGARQYSTEDAVSFAKTFVETPFSGEPRHARRLAQVAAYEETGALP